MLLLGGTGTTGDGDRRRPHREVCRVLDREVERDRHQVTVGARGVRRLEPLVELLEVDAPLAGSLTEHFGHLVPVVVRDPQPRGVLRFHGHNLIGNLRKRAALLAAEAVGLARKRAATPFAAAVGLARKRATPFAAAVGLARERATPFAAAVRSGSDGSRRLGSSSSTRTARPRRTWRQSRSAAGASPRSSATSPASWPPIGRATSRARPSWWTAAPARPFLRKDLPLDRRRTGAAGLSSPRARPAPDAVAARVSRLLVLLVALLFLLRAAATTTSKFLTRRIRSRRSSRSRARRKRTTAGASTTSTSFSRRRRCSSRSCRRSGRTARTSSTASR